MQKTGDQVDGEGVREELSINNPLRLNSIKGLKILYNLKKTGAIFELKTVSSYLKEKKNSVPSGLLNPQPMG